MSLERTLSIIKPDAIKSDYEESINLMIENSGLKIIKKRNLTLTKEQAAQFYSVHSDKPFYNELCEFMCSGPIIVQMLEGEDAIKIYRNLMGTTDPKNAKDNTIRKKYAVSVQENAVHGSDNKENAEKELNFFFKVRIKP
jgi:nucleoside-diphosphate kinase